MLRKTIEKVFREYAVAAKEDFTGHPFADYVRNEIPSNVSSVIPNYPELKVVASAGKGRWSDAPWIGIFDPIVTTTAQEGYYPVYLFTRDLKSVYLSMNQGMAELRKELGTTVSHEILMKRALVLQARLTAEQKEVFPVRNIDLKAAGPQTRLAFYEPGHSFGKRYSRESLPSEGVLVSDLQTMLDSYRSLTFKGGYSETSNESEELETLQEKLSYRLHSSIERNQKLARKAKDHHGFRCQICEMDYAETYGDFGQGYIEAHHLTPLAELPKNGAISLSPVDDFAVLCANCHRMIHRKGAPSTFEEFRRKFRDSNKTFVSTPAAAALS